MEMHCRGSRNICLCLLPWLLWTTDLVAGALEWHLVTNGTVPLSPTARRDAAIGYNEARNRLVVFGGRTIIDNEEIALGDTIIFDIDSGQWRLLQNLTPRPDPRWGVVYGSSDNHFYIATGRGNNNMFYDDIWRFDFRSNRWEELQPQVKPSHYSDAQWVVREESTFGLEPRYAAAGGIFPNSSRFYVAYGFSDIAHKDTLVYSVTDGGWFIESEDRGPYHPYYPHSRYLHAGTMISSDELLVFGGCLSGGGTGGPCPSADAWIYSSRRKSWRRIGSCASPRTSAALAMLPIRAGQRRVVLYGGQEAGPGRQVLTTIRSPRHQVAILDPDSGDWSLTDTLGVEPTKRSSVAMVTGKNGIYMFGGYEINTGKLSNDLYYLLGHSDDADTSPSQDECNPTFFNLIILHGVLMALAWGFFLPWGAFIARYMRHTGKLWYNLHKLFQIFGLILAVFGFICGVLSVQDGHFTFAHGAIGLALMVVGLLQPLNAVLRPNEPKPGQETSRARFWWGMIHSFLGHSGILLGLANISLGVFLAHSHTIIWAVWFGYLGVTVLIHFIMRIIEKRRNFSHSRKRHSGHSQFVVHTTSSSHRDSQQYLQDFPQEDDEM